MEPSSIDIISIQNDVSNAKKMTEMTDRSMERHCNRTLADTLADVRVHPEILPIMRRKRANWLAMFARGTSQPLDQIEENIFAVNAAIEYADPHSAGIAIRTWMTACSMVRTSIKLCGADYTSARNPAPIAPEWRRLLDTVSATIRARLLPIAGVMTSMKVSPTDMGQEHVSVLWENVSAIYPDADIHEKCRVAIEHWNRCASLPNWPKTTLISFSLHDRDVFPPERFSDAFNKGIEEIRRDALAPRRGVLDRMLPVVQSVAKARCIPYTACGPALQDGAC